MKWIETEKRLPPNDTAVIVAVWDGRPSVNLYFIAIMNRMNKRWFYDDSGDEVEPKDGIVTHWMPLPDDPNMVDLVEEKN